MLFQQTLFALDPSQAKFLRGFERKFNNFAHILMSMPGSTNVKIYAIFLLLAGLASAVSSSF